MFLKLKSSLEKIDNQRDRLLFVIIKRYWPRFILPNHLTIFRIILAVLLIILLLFGLKDRVWLIIIFLVAALLDLFDGSVARAFNKTSNLGAALDPIADRILIWPLAVFILIFQHFWLLVMLVLPELFNTGLYLYCNAKKIIKLKTNIFGKTKMVFECIGFAVIILFDFPYPPSRFPIFLLYVAFCFLIADSVYKLFTLKKQLVLKYAP